MFKMVKNEINASIYELDKNKLRRKWEIYVKNAEKNVNKLKRKWEINV